jgi:hypothetical protein
VIFLTTSGGMVTLLAAIGALVGFDQNFTLPTAAVPFLIIALASFSIAAGCGITANRAVSGEVIDVDSLRTMRTKHWEDHEVDARNFVTHININMINSLREGSRKKADWLFIGHWSQLAALAALSVTIFFVIAMA